MGPAVRWAAAGAFAAGIFVLSAVPDLKTPGPQVRGIDKAAHAAVYMLFTGVVWWALRGSNVARAALLAVVIAAAYGVTDEIHQGFVRGRTMSFFDWCADAAGAGLWWTALKARRSGGATPPHPRRVP